jgi:glycerophosphoryl diester phosphodiesterase
VPASRSRAALAAGRVTSLRSMGSGAGAVVAEGTTARPPLIVAHRGAWGAAPQNSLKAFENAIALGCDAVEIDVRRTADGQMVLVHDSRVRLRPVGRLEHEAVRARMKAGQAPLLHDVLALTSGRILVDIELKEDGYVREVMQVISQHLRPDQYVVTSFREGILAQVGDCAPQARRGLLLSPRRLRDVERRVRISRADFIAPHASLARTGVFGWATERQLDVWTWTVNQHEALASFCRDPRIAAVITDVPQNVLPRPGIRVTSSWERPAELRR